MIGHRPTPPARRSLPFMALALAAMAGCADPAAVDPNPGTIGFTSSDTVLIARWEWARSHALSLAHDDAGDPVGPWYEAALPNREAFCARDFSHQALGAHLLGLADQNRNMMSRFARYLSESKDWATYWEIDRLDRGAPVDYRSDDAFWYNLPANFDLATAAARLYRWTADPWYAANDTLNHFLHRSVRDYVARWALAPDSLAVRRRFMNRESFDPGDPYEASRGIPTYNEENPGMTRVGVDLPALQVAAYRAYAYLLRARRGARPEPLALADSLDRESVRIAATLDSLFWNERDGRYDELLLTDGSVIRGGSMEAYVPWAGAAVTVARSRAAAASLAASRPGNVEMRSYLPEIWFAHGMPEEAAAELVLLGDPATERREYPEVAFALVGAFVSGLMGVSPADSSPGAFDAVSTRSRLPAGVASARLTEVPVGGRRIDVRHVGRTATSLVNAGATPVGWIARFDGLRDSLLVNGRSVAAIGEPGALDGPSSFVRVVVAPGDSAVVRVPDR